jgi:hypothetical protein
MYADWAMTILSDLRLELSWLFEKLPRHEQESLAESIIEDIENGLYTPPKKDEEL